MIRSSASARGILLRLWTPERDGGFGLVEVVVALMILAFVAIGATSLAVHASAGALAEDQSQAAIDVATMEMESVRASNLQQNGLGISSLFGGRSKTQVMSNWSLPAYAGIPELTTTTYPEWDPSATGLTVPVIPFGGTTSLDLTSHTTAYTWQIMLGVCYVATATHDNGTCTAFSSAYTPSKASSDPASAVAASAPSPLPSGYEQLVRAIVVVRWPGSGCGGTGCSYVLSSIFEAGRDLKWDVRNVTS